MFILLLVVLVVCLYIVTRVREWRARNLLAGLPSPSCLPFVGNFHHFLGGPKALFDGFNKWFEIAEVHDKPFVLWAGSFPIVMLCKPEDVKIVANTFVDKPYFYNFAKLALGEGIFTASESLWKRSIKKITGAGSFTVATVNGYQEKFSAQADKLVQSLKLKADGGTFDISDMLSSTTLETVCQTVLGSEFIADPTTAERYNKALKGCFHLIERRLFNVLLHPDFIYKLTPMYRDYKKNAKEMHEITFNVIKINEQRRQVKKAENDSGRPCVGYKSYYEHLMELQEKDPDFDMEQVYSELHTVIFAGQETIATTFTFLFLVIGHYSEIQKKLYEEVKALFGDSKRPVTSADLARMPYCEAVIKETLRLYPPAAAVVRYADRDLPLGSYTIPKGAACALGIWGLGHSRRTWGPDAQEFRPERWFESDCPGNTAAFSTFSFGRRSCLGKKYAMAFMKTTVAQCVRELEFESDISNMQLKLILILKPVDPPLIQVRLR